MKRFLSVFLMLCLALSLFAACGSKAPSSTAPATGSSEAAEPVEEEKPYNARLLTGLEKDDTYPEGQRFTAVMVNNMSNTPSQQARPQSGLSAADILVEIKVEGGITRFMALYEDYKTMPEVGPVRSARHQFFQLIQPFFPLYVHIGESVVQTEYKINYDYEDFDLNGDVLRGLVHQDPSRTGVASEHTWVTSGEEIAAMVEENGIDDQRTYNSTFFDFVRYDEDPRVLTGTDAAKIDVIHSTNYRTYFDWDAASGKYLMSQYSAATRSVTPSIDANNDQQLSFDNVLVLFTDIHVFPGHEEKDLQEVDYNFGGVGYYFNGGKSEAIRWMKGTPDSVLRIVDAEGYEQNVKINPGKTYLAVVDLDEAENFQFWPTAEGAATDTPDVDESALDFVDE